MRDSTLTELKAIFVKSPPSTGSQRGCQLRLDCVLPGAAVTGGANSPERRTWLFQCLVSIVHLIFTAIASGAHTVNGTV